MEKNIDEKKSENAIIPHDANRGDYQIGFYFCDDDLLANVESFMKLVFDIDLDQHESDPIIFEVTGGDFMNKDDPARCMMQRVFYVLAEDFPVQFDRVCAILHLYAGGKAIEYKNLI